MDSREYTAKNQMCTSVCVCVCVREGDATVQCMHDTLRLLLGSLQMNLTKRGTIHHTVRLNSKAKLKRRRRLVGHFPTFCFIYLFLYKAKV